MDHWPLLQAVCFPSQGWSAVIGLTAICTTITVLRRLLPLQDTSCTPKLLWQLGVLCDLGGPLLEQEATVEMLQMTDVCPPLSHSTVLRHRMPKV